MGQVVDAELQTIRPYVVGFAVAGKAIDKAFGLQVEENKFAFVEVLASCPTNWAMNPLEANERVADEMIPYFPLGTYKE